MTARTAIETMTSTDCTADFADRLDIEPIDIEHITYEGNAGACYTFTASGSGNVGSAYVDSDFVAIEWGGDPQWFANSERGKHDDREAVEAAINGDLPDA